MFKDPATLTEAERASQAFFNTPERIKSIQECQAAHVKMNEEEKESEVDSIRQKMGMLPEAVSMTMKKRGKPKSPYEADTTKEADMTEQESAPAPGDLIEIGDDNDNDGGVHDPYGQDEDDDNISLPRPARLQGCENDPEEESLFSNESDDDNDENDPDDDYSQLSDGADKKKKSKRKAPKSTIWTPRMSHFSDRKSPAKREAADVLVAIVAEPNVAKFMVMDGLNRITKIQELTR